MKGSLWTCSEPVVCSNSQGGVEKAVEARLNQWEEEVVRWNFKVKVRNRQVTPLPPLYLQISVT